MRSAAAFNPSTPWPVLGRLALDKMASVRRAVPDFNEQSRHHAQVMRNKARSTATPIANFSNLHTPATGPFAWTRSAILLTLPDGANVIWRMSSRRSPLQSGLRRPGSRKQPSSPMTSLPRFLH